MLWRGGGGLNGTVTYTSSQTASSSDNGKLVIMNCSGACAYTLPATQPSTTWQIALQSVGSTTATVGLSGDTYNGGASAPVLVKYDALPIWANSATSTDYDGGTPLVAGSNVSVTPAANGKTIASTGGGSGPSSIVAGSNVTITEGSPCTTATCTINASGGGTYQPSSLPFPTGLSFSWVNQGSATITTLSDTTIVLQVPENGSQNWRLRTVAVPGSTPYSLAAAITVANQGTSYAAIINGLYLTDGTKLEGIECYDTGSGGELRVEHITNATTDGSSVDRGD